MKKLLTIVLCAVLVLGLAAPAAAASGTVTYAGVTIEVDGVVICPMDANGDPVEPFIYNGSTYLPVRSVANALGLNVNWNNGVVELTSGGSGVVPGAPIMSWRDREIEMGGADVKVTLNGTELDLKDAAGRTVTPIVSNGVTYLPVRAIADALNVPVEWDGENTTVYLGQRVEWLETKAVWDTGDGKPYTWTYRYDSKGNVLESTSDYGDGYVRKTTYSYDAAGNLTREHYENTDPEYPRSYTNTYVYDAKGNLVKETNEEKSPKYQESYTTTYTYDAAGNVLSEETVDNLLPKSAPEKTVYTYDAQGRLISEKEIGSYGSEYETLYEYDAAGNLVKETEKSWYSDTVTTYTYDAAGNLLSSYEDDGDGSYDKYEYTYDAAGRVLTEYNEYSFYDGDVNIDKCTYTYDRDGNILSEIDEWTDEAGTTRYEEYYTYDDRGNVTSSRVVDDGAETRRTTEYDKFDNVVRSTYYFDGMEGERTTKYTYDEGGKILREVTTWENGSKDMTTYEYDKAGNLVKMVMVGKDLHSSSQTYEYISVKK